MYNSKKSELMKIINVPDEDKQEIIKVLHAANAGSHFEAEYQDVSCLLYLPDDKILVVGTAGGAIKMYDEDDSEQSTLLKVFLGGHLESEITSIHYCKQLKLLVSGSKNGIVTVWNIGTNKQEHVCYGHTSNIVGLVLLFPYPLLFITCLDGTMSIWTIHCTGSFDNKNHCMIRFVNFQYAESGERQNQLDQITSFYHLYSYGKTIIPVDPTGTTTAINRKKQRSISIKSRLRRSSSTDQGRNHFTYSGGGNHQQAKSEAINNDILPCAAEIYSKLYKSAVNRLRFASQKISSETWISAMNMSTFQSQTDQEHFNIFLGTAAGSILIFDLMTFVHAFSVQKMQPTEVEQLVKKWTIRRPESLWVGKQTLRAVESQSTEHLLHPESSPSCHPCVEEVYDLASSLLTLRLPSAQETKSVLNPPLLPSHPHLKPVPIPTPLPVLHLTLSFSLSPPSLLLLSPVSITLTPLCRSPPPSSSISLKGYWLDYNVSYNWIRQSIRDIRQSIYLLNRIDGRGGNIRVFSDEDNKDTVNTLMRWFNIDRIENMDSGVKSIIKRKVSGIDNIIRVAKAARAFMTTTSRTSQDTSRDYTLSMNDSVDNIPPVIPPPAPINSILSILECSEGIQSLPSRLSLEGQKGVSQGGQQQVGGNNVGESVLARRINSQFNNIDRMDRGTPKVTAIGRYSSSPRVSPPPNPSSTRPILPARRELSTPSIHSLSRPIPPVPPLKSLFPIPDANSHLSTHLPTQRLQVINKHRGRSRLYRP